MKTTQTDQENVISDNTDSSLVVSQRKGVSVVHEREDTNQGSEFFLTHDQIKTILNNCKTIRDRTMIEIMFYCFMRRDEVRSLRIEDIDFQNKWLNLTITKGKKRRCVPILDSVLADLRLVAGNRTQGWVFLSNKNNRLSNVQLNRITGDAANRAGLKNPDPKKHHINPHIFRHSSARLFLKNGGRIEILQKLLGHASITTTVHIYGKPSLDDIISDYVKCWFSKT